MNDQQMPVLPREIEKKSFEIIESEVPEPRPFKGGEGALGGSQFTYAV